MTPAERREHIRQHLVTAHTSLRLAAKTPHDAATDRVAAVRKATLVGIPLPALQSAPGPVSRGVAASGRYSFVRGIAP